MTPSKRAVSVLVWSAVLVVATVVLRATRGDTDQAHVVLAYLLVVLGGSVSSGRALGLTLAAAALLLINFFFQLPYDLLAHREAEPAPHPWVPRTEEGLKDLGQILRRCQ